MKHRRRRAAHAADAALLLLEGIVLDPAGSLLIADPGKRLVRTISPEGVVLTVAAPPTLWAPTGLAVDSVGQLFIADAERHRILKSAFGGAPRHGRRNRRRRLLLGGRSRPRSAVERSVGADRGRQR